MASNHLLMTNTNTDPRKDLFEELTRCIKIEQKTIDDFSAGLAKNPAQAFKWASSAMDAASEIEVRSQILTMLTNGASAADVRKEITRAVLSLARDDSRSSSACRDAMRDAIRKSWTRALSMLERDLDLMTATEGV